VVSLVDAPATVQVVQAMAAGDNPSPLWCVTRGAATSPEQAGVWGLGRVVGLEHPGLWGGLVDLPDVVDEQAVDRLCAVLSGITGEDQVAVRASGVFARRLSHAPAGAPRNWRPTGTVLITGGTGALGARVARWMAGNGAEHLVLTSRRGMAAPGAAELDAELTGLGVRVSIEACDVTDRDALATLLSRLDVRTVVHAAGTGQATALVDLGEAEFADVVSAKVAGAIHLDDLLRGQDLDAFILFSSIAGTWGSGGQAAYAAANASLDALAERRRAQGRPATSIAWGPWAGGGLVARQGGEAQLSRRGLAVLAPDLALAAMRDAVGHDDAVVTVADVAWERFVPAFTAARPSPLLADLPEVAALVPEVLVDESSVLREKLAAMGAVERDRTLVDLVRAEAATVLGHADVGTIDPAQPFRDLGFDSLTAVELRDRLTSATGFRLPTTSVFDHPTPLRLAAALRDGLAPAPEPTAAAELDRLESVISAISPDDPVYEEITGRLRTMLSRMGEGRAGAVRGSGVAERLDAATDDEIFEFIHKELGRS
jgi:NAD(P)-dependent dehydrogenase (short-subunit alcohol dehydrogenase family)/acyl carrier protein